MRKQREALLVAALAGLVIVGAAAFVVQPGLGSTSSHVGVRLGQAAVTAISPLAPGKLA